MVNVVVTVEALASEVHSGMFGGPHPTRSPRWSRCWRRFAMTEGNTTITGLDNTADLDGRAVSA